MPHIAKTLQSFNCLFLWEGNEYINEKKETKLKLIKNSYWQLHINGKFGKAQAQENSRPQ